MLQRTPASEPQHSYTRAASWCVEGWEGPSSWPRLGFSGPCLVCFVGKGKGVVVVVAVSALTRDTARQGFTNHCSQKENYREPRKGLGRSNPRVASTESIGNAAPAGGCSPAPERQHKSPKQKQKLAFCRSEAQSFTHSLPVTGAALWVLASTLKTVALRPCTVMACLRSPSQSLWWHAIGSNHLASNRSPCVPRSDVRFFR